MALVIDEITKGEITTNIPVGAYFKQQYYPDMVVYTYDLDYQVVIGNSNHPSYTAGLYVKSNMVGIRTSPSGTFALEVGGNMSCSNDASFMSDVHVRGSLTLSSGLIVTSDESASTIMTSPNGTTVLSFDDSNNAMFGGTLQLASGMTMSGLGDTTFVSPMSNINIITFGSNGNTKFHGDCILSNGMVLGTDSNTGNTIFSSPNAPDSSIALSIDTQTNDATFGGTLQLASGMTMSGLGDTTFVSPVSNTDIITFGSNGNTKFHGDCILSNGMVLGTDSNTGNTIFSSPNAPNSSVALTMDTQTNNATFSDNVYAKAFYTLSDARAKDDVTVLSPSQVRACQDMVRAMQIKTFRYKGDDTPRVGVLAQDIRRLERHAPFRMVDEATTPVRTNDGVMTIDMSQLVAVLVCSVQDILQKLDCQKA